MASCQIKKSIIDTQKIERNLSITLKKKLIKKQEKKATEKNCKNKEKTINKVPIATYPLIVTLNVNGLNVPIRIHRVAEWI